MKNELKLTEKDRKKSRQTIFNIIVVIWLAFLSLGIYGQGQTQSILLDTVSKIITILE